MHRDPAYLPPRPTSHRCHRAQTGLLLPAQSLPVLHSHHCSGEPLPWAPDRRPLRLLPLTLLLEGKITLKYDPGPFFFCLHTHMPRQNAAAPHCSWEENQNLNMAWLVLVLSSFLFLSLHPPTIALGAAGSSSHRAFASYAHGLLTHTHLHTRTCMHAYTRLHTCPSTLLYTCLYTYMYVYLHTHTHPYIVLYTPTHMHAHLHTHMPTHTVFYTYLHTHLHTSMHAHLHTYLYTHLHIHIPCKPMHTLLCMHKCMLPHIHTYPHSYTCLHIFTCIHFYTHAYKYTDTHSYTHTYTHIYNTYAFLYTQTHIHMPLYAHIYTHAYSQYTHA